MKSLVPVNFGRETDTGRYAKDGGIAGSYTDLLGSLKQINTTIKEQCAKLFDKLSELVSHKQHQGADDMAVLADKFERAFAEQETFTQGLISAAKGLSALNFRDLEGIFFKGPEATRVIVTNWGDSKLGEQASSAVLPILGPVLAFFKTALGVSRKKEDLLKVEVQDFGRVVKATEATAVELNASFERDKPLPFLEKLFRGKQEPKRGILGDISDKLNPRDKPKSDQIFNVGFEELFNQLSFVLDAVKDNTQVVHTDLVAILAALTKPDVTFDLTEEIEDLFRPFDDEEKELEDEQKNGAVPPADEDEHTELSGLTGLFDDRIAPQFTVFNQSLGIIVESLRAPLHVWIDNWNEMQDFSGLLGGGPQSGQSPLAFAAGGGNKTQLVPNYDNGLASLNDWHHMNAEQREQYKKNKYADAEKSYAEQERQKQSGGSILKLPRRKIVRPDQAGPPAPPEPPKTPPPSPPSGGPPTRGRRPRGRRGGGRGGFLDVGAIGGGLASLGGPLSALSSTIVGAIPGLAGLAAAVGLTGPALVALGVALAPLTAIALALAAALAAIVAAVVALGVGFTLAVNAASSLASGFTKTGTTIVEGFNDVFGRLAHGDFYGAIGGAASTVVKAFDNVSDAFLGMVPVFGEIAGNILKSLTGAVQTAISVFTGFAQNMLPFVQQISPATLESFNLQIRNLQATIGLAFVGFVGQMADTIKEIGGILLPVAEEIKPVFDELGGILRSLLLPSFRVLAAVIGTFINPLKAAMGGLRTVVLETVKALVLLGGMIARLVGADDFLSRLTEAFRAPEGRAGATAVGNASSTNFESIAKDIAVAAAQASVSAASGAETRSDHDLLHDIAETLDSISNDTFDELMERFANAIEEFWNRLQELWDETTGEFWDWAENELGPLFSKVMDKVWEKVSAWLERRFPLAAAARDVASGYLNNPTSYLNDVYNFYTGRGVTP